MVSEDSLLVAVASWTEDYAQGFPDIYRKTYSHLEWIRRKMKNIVLYKKTKKRRKFFFYNINKKSNDTHDVCV